MKIIVPKGLSSKSSLSYSKTRKVADLLEESELLDKENIRLKKKYNIPPNGYPLFSDEHYMTLSDRLGFFADKYGFDIIKDFDNLTKALNLPQYWSFSITTLIFNNTLLPPEDESFSVILPAKIGSISDPFGKYPWAMSNESFHEFVSKLVKEKALMLIIRKDMKKSELHKMIRDNWDDIQNGMKVLPSNPTHKMIRLRLAKEIRELRDDKKLTYAKIADILSDKYKENLELYDLLTEDYVKNLYSRLRKKSSKSIT